jgi:hypothetical protein
MLVPAQVEVRIRMLEHTPALVAGAGELQHKVRWLVTATTPPAMPAYCSIWARHCSCKRVVHGADQMCTRAQVLRTAATRLQDYDEKVRAAAVRALCTTVRRLLVGPPAAAATAAAAASPLSSSPATGLLGSMLESQEDGAAAAAELGVPYSPPLRLVQSASGSVDAQGGANDAASLAFLTDMLQRVSLRLRDTKPAVRKAAATGLLSVYRAAIAAGASACCRCRGAPHCTSQSNASSADMSLLHLNLPEPCLNPA